MPIAAGNFIPEVWSKKLNRRFYGNTVCMAVANRNWEGDITGHGNKVIIRGTPEVLISDYSAHGTLTYETLSVGKQELLIDRGKAFSFKVDDIEKVQSDVALVNAATTDAGHKMKIHVDKDVLGNIYADCGQILDGSSGIDKSNVTDYIVDSGTLLDESNIPEEGRWIIIPPWMAGMIKKSDLSDASISGDGTSMKRNGYLGVIDRYKIYVSNHLASVDDAGVAFGESGFDPSTLKTKCIAGTKDLFCFASQFTKSETVRLVDQFGDGIRGLNCYGFKVTNPEAGIMLNSKRGV